MSSASNHSQTHETSVNINRFFCLVLAAYLALTALVYILAGDQLRFRASRGAVVMREGQTAACELTEGTVVEQTFSAPIQRLFSASVRWGTFYRVNRGTITMELEDPRTGRILMEGSFDASLLREGEILTIRSEDPIEDQYDMPLILRLRSDSPAEGGAAPLMDPLGEKAGWSLRVNGQTVPGILSFSADGEDNIWTGLHYWKFVTAFGLVLTAGFAVVRRRMAAGKHSYVYNAVLAMKKYRFLIGQLVARDFKTKYKRSALGALWSFFNPLLMMSVQYFVFSTLFRSNIPNYPVYLLTGIVSFNFFSEACGMSLTSVLGNASLLTKVYMPKYIYPLTRVISSLINFLISLLPLLIVCAVTGVRFAKATVLAGFFWVCLVIFVLGMGMLLASSMVFFRDTQFLWGVMSMIWMYATPIFYPESIIPESFRWILRVNPLYHFISSARMCILDGLSPEPVVYFRCLMMALGMLLAGAAIFRQTQDKFVLYL